MTAVGLSHDELQRTLSSSPFTAFLNLQLVELQQQPARVSLRMPLRPELERVRGSSQFQGGAIATLVDTAGVYALLVEFGAPAPTVSLTIDYLRPAVSDQVVATATVRRPGRTISVVDVEVFDGEQRLCALGRGSYATPPPEQQAGQRAS